MSRPEFRHAAWRKSSHSHGNGGCVEVAFTGWRTSSHSGGNGDCVEVALARTLVGVRDSKDPAGSMLAVDSADWSALLTAIRDGELSPGLTLVGGAPGAGVSPFVRPRS